MKILLLINDSIWLYKLRYELVNILIQNKHEVYLSLPDGEYIDKFLEIGCKFIETNYNRRDKKIFYELILLKKYSSMVTEINPDLVLIYTTKPNIYGSIIARLKNKPYINNVTGVGGSVQNGGLFPKIIYFLYRIALKKSKCIRRRHKRIRI